MPTAWLRRPVGILLTFHFVLLTWIFFRASSLHDVQTLFQQLFAADGWRHSLRALVSPYELLVAVTMVAAMELAHFVEARNEHVQPFFVWQPRGTFRQWTLMYALLIAILLFGEFRHQEFIYFQF